MTSGTIRTPKIPFAPPTPWQEYALAHKRVENQTSDHFDGERFYNPGGAANAPPLSNGFRMLRERRTPWPRHVEVTETRPPALSGSGIIVTFIGHSTFLIQTTAGNILTDPVYSDRASPLSWIGPRRVRQPAVRFNDLPPIAMVLLSHNHYDHCDVATLAKLADRDDPLVVTALGNAPLVRSTGIRRIEELDWWDRARQSPVPVLATPAYHFSARGLFDRNRALWCGFIIDTPAARIYFAGDSAYGNLFRQIRQRSGPIDLALIPIGAYEPRWFMKAVHMNPDEAMQAHADLQAQQSLAMHYGTFPMAMEGIDEPLRRLEEARRASGVDETAFRALGFGESLRVGG